MFCPAVACAGPSLTMCRSAAVATTATGVPTVLVQFAAAGQVGSPPPLTVAVFVTVVPPAAAVGVTGIVKLTGALGARPAAIVHVTSWPDALQPPGSAPIASVPGMLSATIVAALVAALPMLVTCSV